MAISFRDTFGNLETSRKRYEETLKKLRAEAIERKDCCVCKHWSFDDTVPPFVTYEGDCGIELIPFFGKKEECEYWEIKENLR